MTLAGKVAPEELLANIPRLVAAYYTTQPDPENSAQRVSVRHFRTPRHFAFGQL